MFHTSVWHRYVHFRLFAQAALDCGVLHKAAHAMETVDKGRLCHIATPEMTDLKKDVELDVDYPAKKDAFVGPDSIEYVRLIDALCASTFDTAKPEQERCAKYLMAGGKLIRKVHKLMLCLDFFAPDKETQQPGPGEQGPTLLRAAAGELNKWILGFDNKLVTNLQHTGKDYYNSAFHNMQHVCDMADYLWRWKIPIGRLSEQGSEAANKLLKFEFSAAHCNFHRTMSHDDNMFSIAINNLWRGMFQYNELDVPIRKAGVCQACKQCDDGTKRCVRHPDCQTASIKRAHCRECKDCWHSNKYEVFLKYDAAN